MALTVFKCYPNLSLVDVGAQTLKGGNISLVTAQIDQFKGPFSFTKSQVGFASNSCSFVSEFQCICMCAFFRSFLKQSWIM